MYRKTATDALDEYIDKYEGKSRSRHFTRRVSDLLSPKPNADLSDSSKDSKMSSKDSKLLSWINESYKNSVRSTCIPLYSNDGKEFRSSSPTNAVASKSMNYEKNRYLQRIGFGESARQISDDLSSLPSPRTSEPDVDSDRETIETEILLSSYHKGKQGQDGLSPGKGKKSPTSSYPKWVDEVSQSELNDTIQRRLSSVSVLLKSTQPSRSLSKSKSMDSSRLTMDDNDSIVTDVILDTSIYGKRPVNMGGDLHSSLFKDERVEAILNNSRKKIKKQRDGYMARSLHGSSRISDVVMSPESRDVAYAKHILNTNRNAYGNNTATAYSRSGPKPEAFDTSQAHLYKTKVDYFVGEKSRAKLFSESRGQMSNGSSANHIKQFGKKPVMKTSLAIERSGLDANVSTNRLRKSYEPYKETLVPGTRLTDNDKVDVNSQRTSGYHSDVISPLNSHTTYDFYAPRKNSPDRTVSSIRDGTRFEASRRYSRKGSDSTDILLRGPPAGTKVHQRSKTWNSHLSTNKVVPNAVSTPKYPAYYRPSGRSALYTAERQRSPEAKGISSSASPRAPPPGSPQSTFMSRSYGELAAPYSASPARVEKPRTSQLSGSEVASQARKSFEQYTDWKALAEKPDQSRKFVLREETGEYDREPDVMRTGNGDDADSNGFSDGDLDDEYGSPHNRTWPSLERFKQRISQYPSRNVERDTSQASWTAAKRSIPLRVNKSFSTGIAPPADVPMRRQFSALAVGNHRSNPNDARNKSVDYDRSSAGAHATSRSSAARLRSESSRSSAARLRSVSSRNNSATAPSNFDSRTAATNLENDLSFHSDDDNATIDTDVLLSQPPMPIVDASPSLSTVSDDNSTIKGSESGDSGHSFADLPVRSSSRVSFAPDVSLNQSKEGSHYNRFESFRGREANADLIREPVHKSFEYENAREMLSRSANADSKATRSELLDSFIDDCMRTANNGPSQLNRSAMKKTDFQSARDEPRTVETLKNLLLNLSGVGSNEEEAATREDDSDYDCASGNTTDDAASVVGEQSLARAYHHLERLKSLINSRTDNRSAVFD